jgi:hypothetical protein
MESAPGVRANRGCQLVRIDNIWLKDQKGIPAGICTNGGGGQKVVLGLTGDNIWYLDNKGTLLVLWQTGDTSYCSLLR